MLKFGDFVNIYEDGEIKTDGSVETDTGLITAAFIETNLIGEHMISQFETVHGDIFPICLQCHTHVLVSQNECSNENCPSNISKDADQIDLFNNTI